MACRTHTLFGFGLPHWRLLLSYFVYLFCFVLLDLSHCPEFQTLECYKTQSLNSLMLWLLPTQLYAWAPNHFSNCLLVQIYISISQFKITCLGLSSWSSLIISQPTQCCFSYSLLHSLNDNSIYSIVQA